MTENKNLDVKELNDFYPYTYCHSEYDNYTALFGSFSNSKKSRKILALLQEFFNLGGSAKLFLVRRKASRFITQINGQALCANNSFVVYVREKEKVEEIVSLLKDFGVDFLMKRNPDGTYVSFDFEKEIDIEQNTLKANVIQFLLNQIFTQITSIVKEPINVIQKIVHGDSKSTSEQDKGQKEA